MSLVAHHPHDLPGNARHGAPARDVSLPAFAKGKTLLMQGLRMLGAALAVATVVAVAAGIKLAIWLPHYWH